MAPPILCYAINSISGPEVGLPGQILADFEVFLITIRPKCGPQARSIFYVILNIRPKLGLSVSGAFMLRASVASGGRACDTLGPPTAPAPLTSGSAGGVGISQFF